MDGYAPYQQVWRQWETVVAARAWDRLTITRAVIIPKLEQQAATMAFDADTLEAFGG